jgi:hypothetical protein
MERALCDRLAACLDRPEILAIDPERVGALRAALDEDDPPTAAGRGGAVTGYAPGPGRRRLVTIDRRGHLTAACRWRADGTLLWAKCLTGNGDWIGIEPAAEHHPAWGLSDRLWLLDSRDAWAPREALTLFQALDYARPDVIPPLFAPARLPPGAGTAVLNLIAGLMKDQGVARVRYRGPYPTEQLFTALLECFRHDPALDDPLRRFMDEGDVDWIPAPHERHLVAPGVSVQLRHQIDKVVLDGVAFYRRDWQGLIRHEPRVVREEGARVVCSLWALGRSLEDRLTLDRSGEVQERPAPAQDPIPPAPLPPVWAPALAELIARESAPALAAPLRDVMRALTLEWGAVPGDLLEVDGARVRVSRRLRAAGVEWVGESAAGPERAQRAIAFVVEVARLVAPAARLRAQARLAASSAAEQARALDTPPHEGALPESVGRLLALVATGHA